MGMPQWVLRCYWCKHAMLVGAGGGLQAAKYMERHVIARHKKTWREYILLTSDKEASNAADT